MDDLSASYRRSKAMKIPASITHPINHTTHHWKGERLQLIVVVVMTREKGMWNLIGEVG